MPLIIPIAFSGIIHCHSRHSYDSFTPVSEYLRFAEKRKLSFVILTDHESIAGSLELRRLVKLRGAILEVPLAAEYATDHGDVIAAFIKDEIKSRSFPDFVKEVRGQGGIILFPHPYHCHSGIERIASESDLIEVYNARVPHRFNRAAFELAAHYGKKIYFASDAHLSISIGNVIVEVESCGGLKESLLRGKIRTLKMKTTSKADLLASQFIKAIKRHDLKHFAYLCHCLIVRKSFT